MYSELAERISWGEEFLFVYENEHYWISQNGNGHFFTRVSDGNTQEFKTAQDLLDNARIKNKSIHLLWDKISEQF